MCVLVTVEGVPCDTVGELQAALIVPLVREKCYQFPPKPGDCLCGIDVEESARRAEYAAEFDPADNEWRLTRLPQFIQPEEQES